MIGKLSTKAKELAKIGGEWLGAGLRIRVLVVGGDHSNRLLACLPKINSQAIVLYSIALLATARVPE